MPHLSLALALVIVAGLAGGVLVDTPLTSMLSVMLAAGWIIGVAAFLWHWPHAQLVGLGLSVVAAAWLLGGHALDRALHPPLRVILEQRLGGFSIDRLAEGRQESPVMIEGRLRGDAVLTETGAIARIDVERVWLGPCPE